MSEEFRVTTVQDYPAFQVMIRVWMPLYHPTKGWWFYLGGAVLAVLLWVMLNFNGLSLPLAYCLRAAILIICLAIARPARRGLERRLCRTLGRRTYESARNRDAQVEYRFEKNRALVRDQFGQNELKYSAITQAAETEDYFLLFLGENVCHILSKSGFQMGKPERFAPFLAKVTGKPVRTFTVTSRQKKAAKQ
jgi:hypothetical protein